MNKHRVPIKEIAEVEIKDFGPISDGKIILKPLTIFIGPNNSGKSYAAMLIRAIFESQHPLSIIELFLSTMYSITKRSSDLEQFKFPELEKIVNDLKEKEEADVPEQLIERIINMIFKEIYEKILSNEITRSFASKLDELIRIGKESFKLRIRFDSYYVHLIYQQDKIKIIECPRIDTNNIRIKLRVKEEESLLTDQIVSHQSLEDSSIKCEIIIAKHLLIKRNRNFVYSRIMRSLIHELIRHIYKIFRVIRCYYLPAARSGILQGHRALAASIVRRAPYVGIEEFEIPKFSGTISDFISSILTLPEETEGPFYKLAQDFEKELIRGKVVVRTLEEHLSPEIKYSFMDKEIPLHRASSTVSELAPLLLYLKYKIIPNNVLIIEEPEAHLHPQNQRILAKFLVRMIRKGLKIIITTHSEFLLEQLNNFILLSKIESNKRREYKYSEEDYLNPDEVSVHVFNYDDSTNGYKIVKVEIDEEDGISQEEFLKVHEALYEETYKLQKDINT
jgi:predicted ATPase